MNIAICPGHHEDSKGATNKKHNVNEYDEACKVIQFISTILIDSGHSLSVIHGKLSRKIVDVNNGNFDLAIDLHFNAGGGRGCEVLYVPGSVIRHEQAEVMSKEISLFMNLRDRGAKEGWYMKGDNPGTQPDAFVVQTNCAAFSPERLFIDNDKEVEYWFVAGRHEQMAEAIVAGINEVIS